MATSPLPKSEVLDLTVDELALDILRHVVESPSSASRTYLFSPWTWNPGGTGLPWDQVEAKVTAAWELLVRLRLVDEVPAPDQLTVATVTDRGRAAAGRGDLHRARADVRIDMGLHSLLERDVCAHYERGDFETAIFNAMRTVEIRIRELGEYGNDEYGVTLVRKAFNETTGPLTDSAQIVGEQQATAHLFHGALGVFKNPSSHRQVDFDDPAVAAGVVLLADLLLRMLDNAGTRIEDYKRFIRVEVGDGSEEVTWPTADAFVRHDQ